jgi:hypothetical protein
MDKHLAVSADVELSTRNMKVAKGSPLSSASK